MSVVLDKNVLMRFFMQDNVEQFEICQDFINSFSEKRPAFIRPEVLVTLVCLLEYANK